MIERFTKKEDGVTYTSMNFKGDILVAFFPTDMENIKNTYGLLFQNEGKEIGIGLESSQIVRKETDITENSVLMKFRSYKSLDVIIKQMQTLREWLYDNETIIVVSKRNDFEHHFTEFEEKLKSNDSSVVSSACLEILKLLHSPHDKSQEEFGEKIANALFEQALMVYNKSDLDMLRVFFNNARAMYFIFPGNEAIAEILLQLVRGMLELKFQKHINDDLDIHQDDIEKVVKNFPTNEKIGLECMMCYANLQENCWMAARNKYPFAPSLSFVERNADHMEAISSKFPNNEEISLVYCRSLAGTAYDLSHDSNPEMYNKFIGLLKNLVKTRSFDVPKDIQELMQMLENR